MMEPKKPQKVKINKYGDILDYSKAYPTPLGKYLELAEN